MKKNKKDKTAMFTFLVVAARLNEAFSLRVVEPKGRRGQEPARVAGLGPVVAPHCKRARNAF
jgi:hypothetical protein